MVTGAITFAVGVFAFAKGIANSRVLSRRLTWLVVGALVVLAISRLVPVGVVQFYVQGAAGIVALWPLAYGMWKRPEAARPAGQPRPMPAA
jgi:nitric oxide reductase large subunit